MWRGCREFLSFWASQKRPFHGVTIADIDALLASLREPSVTRNQCQRLRAFFRYAARRGWCSISVVGGGRNLHTSWSERLLGVDR